MKIAVQHLPENTKGRSKTIWVDQPSPFDSGSFVQLVSGLADDKLEAGQFFTMSAWDDESAGRKRDHVSIVYGFSLDLDMNEPGRADVQQAKQILADIPEPTWVIQTGSGGVHLHWVFEKPFICRDDDQRKTIQWYFERFQKVFIERATRLGVVVDKTAGIERLWRLPGSYNYKHNPPKPVGFRKKGGPLHDFIALAGWSGKTTGLDNHSKPEKPNKRKPGRPPKIENKTRIHHMLEKHVQFSKGGDWYHVLRGEAIAPKGQRDNALQRLCSTLAFMFDDQNEIVDFLIPCLESTAKESDDPEWSLESSVENARRKIERAFSDKQKKQEESERFLKGVLPKHIAEKVGAFDGVDKNKNPLIIVVGSHFFVYDFKRKTYRQTSKHGAIALSENWRDYGVELHDEKGKRLGFDALLQRYANSADGIHSSWLIERSYWDPETAIFYESLKKEIKHQPVYNPEIHLWLSHLGGEDLLNWLATYGKLERPTPLLYLEGPACVGKSLLVSQLSEAIGATYSSNMGILAGGFGESFLKTPIIHVEEGLRGKSTSSDLLRSLIGGFSADVNAKYQPVRQVSGSPRIVITANNSAVLSSLFAGAESAEDVEAIRQRILHIKTKNTDLAKQIIDELQEKGEIDNWVTQGKIVSHLLWLMQNRKVESKKRFLITNDVLTSAHMKAFTATDDNHMVRDWIYNFYRDPKALMTELKTKGKESASFYDGKNLWVAASEIYDHWEVYMRGEKRPSVTKIGRVLNPITEEKERIKVNGQHVRRSKIQNMALVAWDEESGFGLLEEAIN